MIKSWSWTRYSDYKQCPRKFKYKYIDKLKEEKSDALTRGAEIHDLIASYITGKIKQLPEELKAFATEFKALQREYKKKKFIVEDEWAYTSDWSATKWDDWNHVWLRMKLDCARPIGKGVLSVVDWKTGKFRPSPQYEEQLELYAVAALAKFPDIDTVHPQLVYIDAEIVHPPSRDALKFTREDLPRLQVLWHERTRPMFTDKTHETNKSVLCGWCAFRKVKGGPCEHGTRNGN